MFQNLTGSFAENINNFNYKKILKSNLYYSLFNRKDENDSVLNWGESLLIKVEDNTFSYDDDLVIFDYSTNYRFKVLKVLGNWLLVNMFDNTNSINYVKFSNELANKEYWVTNQYIKRPIISAFATNTYNYLNVEMRSLDTFGTYPDFGNLLLKIDDIGTIVCYNLSYNFFINFNKNKFSSLSFDLCHKNNDYIPIIRNLKFKDLKSDSIVFEYVTNNNSQYVVFTTKNYEVNYSIYPDTFYDINNFISLSNDYKVHQQYSNYLNDFDIYDSLQHGTLVNIPSNQIFYAKEYFGGESIDKYTFSDKTLVKCETLIDDTNICYSNADIIKSRFKVGDKIKIGSTIYTINNLSYDNETNIATITLDSNIAITGFYNIIVNDYTKTSIKLENVDFYYSSNGISNKFIVDTATLTNGNATFSTTIDLRQYFVATDKIYLVNIDTGDEIEATVQSITSNSITLTSNYSGDTGNTKIYATYFKPYSDIDLIFTTYNGRLYGYTSTESIAKKYGLSNLLVTFTHSTATSFRQLGLFYDNVSPVCTYLSENSLITIPSSYDMNFAIIL